MLKIPSEALPYPLEAFLDRISEDRPRSIAYPTKFKWEAALGGSAQLVQVVATASKIQSDHLNLQVSASFAQSQSIREAIAGTVPGMAALYFSRRIISGDRPIPRNEALELVRPRVLAMSDSAFRNTVRGRGVALCCFMGAKSEFLPPLYALPNPDAVRDYGEFQTLIRKILGVIGREVLSELEGPKLAILGSIAYELFQNAEQHGSYSVDGRRLKSGLRGIQVRHIPVEDVLHLMSDAGSDSAVISFLTRLKFSTTTKRPERATRTSFVEMSVFDTGVGMPLKWLSAKQGFDSYDSFSLKDEEEALLNCFEKHATTKAIAHVGVGLTSALAAMTRLGAFMMLRSGRLSLYQDFSRTLKETSFRPRRRFSASRKLSAIAGTSYTIYFPVG